MTANNLTLFNIYSGQDFHYKYPHGDKVYNVVTAYICRDYEGGLRRDENEVHELKFFNFTVLPPNISQPDLPIINEFIEKCLLS